MITKPEPLEKTDPELGQLLMDVANGRLAAHVQDIRVFQMKNNAHDKSSLRNWPYRVRREVQLDVGRNDPCVCGSGKKYKKCCMKG